jgi:hypothetical protein
LDEFRFFTGTHKPHWLWSRPARIPWFVSDVTLGLYRTLHPAREEWALDSGGFSQLSKHGTWSTPGKSPAEYVRRVRRYRDEIGRLAWAAPQDWMCEPQIIAKTGLSVLEHQRRTVANLLQLRDLAPDLRFIPVIQGYAISDYVRCVEMYRDSGIDLASEPTVGVGSVCRRQKSNEAAEIIRELHSYGLKLHGFGFKILGLQKVWKLLASADSMAWSFAARWEPPLHGCPHRSCANCQLFAIAWRSKLLAGLV